MGALKENAYLRELIGRKKIERAIEAYFHAGTLALLDNVEEAIDYSRKAIKLCEENKFLLFPSL